jgi:2-polyprenyl-3-methyl-5-hydroxy-6-metoxy-1,4-benzoquinol methylase
MLDTFKLQDKEAYRKFFNECKASNSHLTAADGRPSWIAAKVKAANPKKVLEIGCQTGGMTKILLEICPNVTAVDIIQENVDLVTAMGAKGILSFVEDLDELKLGKFDVVTITEVLNHVIGVEKAVKNAWACVKKGGHLIVTVPHGSRWIDQAVARKFDSFDDLHAILQPIVNVAYNIETLDWNGNRIFYAVDITK